MAQTGSEKDVCTITRTHTTKELINSDQTGYFPSSPCGVLLYPVWDGPEGYISLDAYGNLWKNLWGKMNWSYKTVFLCYVQKLPADVEITSFYLKNLQIQQLPKETEVFPGLLYLHLHYVCIFRMASIFQHCLCALLNISGFTPNSMAPPYRQSSSFFLLCYVSSIDVTSPDTVMGFSFRRYRPTK